MNKIVTKIIKTFFAIIGAFSVVFDIATPTLLVILLLTVGTLSDTWTPVLIICGIIATLYRGLKQFIFLLPEY